MELESRLEGRCCRKIEKLGGLALKITVLNLRGVPDRLILLPMGRSFFVEFKRQKTGHLSKQQIAVRAQLTSLGFTVCVIDNDKDFDDALMAKS